MKTGFAIAFMILSIVIHKFEGVFTKKYSAKNTKGGFIFTAIVSFFSMLFFLLMDFISDENGLHFGLPVLLWGFFSGVCFAAASMTMYWALEHGPYGLTTFISSLGILITIGYGIVIGEKVSLLSWIGIVLIGLSLYLIKARGGRRDKTKMTAKWMAVLVFSVLCSSAFSVLQRQQQRMFVNAYDNEFMIVTLSVSAVILFVAGMMKDGKFLKDIFRHGFLYAAGGGVSNGLTNLLTLLVYTMVPISFVAPMKTGMNIVIAFLIARLIFKEKYTVRQYVGVSLGCVALVLFNI